MLDALPYSATSQWIPHPSVGGEINTRNSLVGGMRTPSREQIMKKTRHSHALPPDHAKPAVAVQHQPSDRGLVGGAAQEVLIQSDIARTVCVYVLAGTASANNGANREPVGSKFRLNLKILAKILVTY